MSSAIATGNSVSGNFSPPIFKRKPPRPVMTNASAICAM